MKANNHKKNCTHKAKLSVFYQGTEVKGCFKIGIDFWLERSDSDLTQKQIRFPAYPPKIRQQIEKH